MATQGGRARAPLSEALFDEGYRFEFFQAVRVLEDLDPEKQRVGGDSDPRNEAVRFRSDVSLSFPASDIQHIGESDFDDAPPEMTVRFLGVATPASFGSLPTCYTELVAQRAREKDRALLDFLDLFNHRLLSLFYRSWEKHRFDLVYERSDALEGGPFERALLSWMGLGSPGVRGRLEMPDIKLLPWAGSLCRRCASAEELGEMVAAYFETDVDVEQFVPGRYRAATEDRLRLDWRSGRLGRDTYLGELVTISQARFRLRVGPLGWTRYDRLLPPEGGFRELCDLVRLAVGPEFDFEVQLILNGEDALPLRLHRDGERAPRLGWTTWLFSGELGRDPDDVVLSPEAGFSRSAPIPPAED